MDDNPHAAYQPKIYHAREWHEQELDNIIDLTPLMNAELAEIQHKEIAKDYPYSLVYYPWLNSYYKILNEEDFITVRTNRNKNKITEQEQAILRTKKVAIIGQSTGSQLAYILAQERICGHLILADADTLSLANLNRLRAGITQLGLPKTVIIARAIAELDPYIKVDIITDQINAENKSLWQPKLAQADLLVDACDGMNSKLMLRFFARNAQIPVIMETNDKGRIDVERYDLQELPLLNGGFEDISESTLKSMSNAAVFERLLLFFAKTGGLSQKMLASLPLIGTALLSYPQLASETVAGAATLATCIRKIFLNEFQASGSFFVDLEEIIRAC